MSGDGGVARLRLHALALLSPVLLDSIHGLGQDGQARRTIALLPGDSFHIRPGTIHRMIAEETCDVLEVSTPELDDVVRLEDRYGREGTNEA